MVSSGSEEGPSSGTLQGAGSSVSSVSGGTSGDGINGDGSRLVVRSFVTGEDKHSELKESGEQRRRRLETLPDRAEMEIMRMRFSSLRDEVSRYKLEEKARRRRGRQVRRRRREEKRWREKGETRGVGGGVLFTTLAEVALEDTSADVDWADHGCASEDVENGDGGVEELFSECLRELDDT